MPGEILDTLRHHEGQLVLVFGNRDQWLAAVHFGDEGGGLAAGAAYGYGVTPEDAMVSAAQDLGRR